MPEDGLGDILSVLCPMFVRLDPKGRIVQVGPTLEKLFADRAVLNHPFLEVFNLSRPRRVEQVDELMADGPVRIRVRFRHAPQHAMKGVFLPLGSNKGAVVNLSFGFSILDAVRDYKLTSADFAITDLAIEMLYLFEAKSVAMEASRRLNQRLQGARIAAEEQAFTDTLTGLKNRRAMDHVLNRLSAAETPFALMQVDLDFFKAVNDELGHAAGDFVLQQVARIMIDVTRSSDTIVRAGGDEFVLIFADHLDRAQLSAIAGRLIARVEEPMMFEERPCRISASIGVALSPGGPRMDVTEVLANADEALYQSKRSGRARVTFYPADPSLDVPAPDKI